MSTHDLVVVGGGPIGLAAAVEASLRGLDVVLVEPRTGAVDKACGEGLMPSALAALQRLGVDPPGHAFTGITYRTADGRGSASHDFRGGPGRGVRRTALHTALGERAAQLGVPVLTRRVRALEQDGELVRLRLSAPRPATPGTDPNATASPATGPDGDDAEGLLARWVVACDGLHSPVRRLVGLDAGSDGLRHAVRRHAAVAPWSSHVQVFWGPDVEAYVTPVGEGEVGVAVEGHRSSGLRVEAALQQLPALAAHLRGAEWTTSERGAGPLRQRVTHRAAGRVLLAGDAAGYVDALTGEGLSTGFASARAAVAAVAGAADVAGALGVAAVGRGYEGEWRRATRSYRWLTGALVTATRPAPVRRRVVALAAAAPWLFGAAVESVSRSGGAPRPGAALTIGAPRASA